ncbi:MAG: hypothetical protein KGM15_01455 [Pseudomonadota bacterium]|nr:hypothetical protein [Pseudomonadota bacterium]
MNKRPIGIHGYAIVSDDDRIAGADGLIPPSLRNERDWELYQAALARSDLVVFARVSHDNEPNTRGDPRLVVSHSARGLERRADAWWWNPAQVDWAEVAARLLPDGGEVAAPGGQGVFDLFLKLGYDRFHLARARGVRLPGGRAIFSECDDAVSAEAVLTKYGLRLAERIELDAAQQVEMNIWRRARMG